jgi:hypothetical protein
LPPWRGFSDYGDSSAEDLWRPLRRDRRLEGEFEMLRGDGSRSWARFCACWQFGIGEHLIAALEIEPRAPWCALTRWTLTVREREVLQLAAYGHSSEDRRRTVHQPGHRQDALHEQLRDAQDARPGLGRGPVPAPRGHSVIDRRTQSSAPVANAVCDQLGLRARAELAARVTHMRLDHRTKDGRIGGDLGSPAQDRRGDQNRRMRGSSTRLSRVQVPVP